MQQKRGRTAFCRLLIVEDSEERVALFRDWIPERFRATFVKSAGRAMKVLELDAGRVYAGILLDHDLDQAVAAESELQLSGRQVVEQLVRKVDVDVPVLIHSVNPLGARMMEQNLVEHGFDVTRVPFFNLDRQRLGRWLEVVWEEWEAGD
jgi:CheY-like chemotaxis protein